MAKGFRLHHPTERSCTYLVKTPRKTYHLNLDSEGDVLVSETVFERLKEVQLGGLLFLNTVAEPPTLHINMNGTNIKARTVRWKPNG